MVFNVAIQNQARFVGPRSSAVRGDSKLVVVGAIRRAPQVIEVPDGVRQFSRFSLQSLHEQLLGSATSVPQLARF